jgi:hypothetical protein
VYDWLLGHRGDDDAQLELRALFGLPAAVAGSVEVYSVTASSLVAGVRAVEQVKAALGAGAAALVDDRSGEGVAAALALALAGADGQMVFSRATQAAFAEHLCFVRAKRRPGWRLPTPCVALAEAPYTRGACRLDAATLRTDGAFVARDDERDTLVAAMARGTPPFAVVRAEPGLGATRLVQEAAAVAGARLHRCVVARSGPDEAQMARIITDLCMLDGDGARWLVLELPPGKPNTFFTPESLAARTPGVGFVVVASPDCETPWCPPDREVELGPLAAAEARSVVRAMLGTTAAEALVSALAKRGGSAPRPLVTVVRTAAASGEIVRDVVGDVVTWRTRRKRLLRPSPRAQTASRHPPHVAALDVHLRRAWDVCLAAGDGVDRYALRGLLRVVLSAPDAAAALETYGLAEAMGTTVDLGRTSGARDGDANLLGRAAALQTSGSLDVLAEAERALDVRAPDAASRFARAARASLAVGDLAAAVRLAGMARSLPRPAGDRVVDETLRAIAAQLGALQVLTPRSSRPVLTPEALEAAAAARVEAGDVAGGQRLRALAALLQGDLRPAFQVGRAAASVRDLVVASLAHARSGQLTDAARAAVAGLARARREGDAHGEQATLALLASVFGAAGRGDDVGRFTAAMRG